MSAIDQIKRNSGITIDATNSGNERSLNIDMVNGKEDKAVAPSSNVMNLGSLRSGSGRHQVVLPKNQQNEDSVAAENIRSEVPVIDLGEPEPVDPNIHESVEKDILDVNNPNSIFRKYVDEKQQEAAEWLSEKEEERKILESESYDENEDLNYDEDLNEDSNEPGFDREYEQQYETTPVNMETLEDEDLNEDPGTTSYEEDPDNTSYEEGPEKSKQDVSVYETTEKLDITEEEPDEEVPVEDDEEVLKKLQKLATEKLKPVSKKLDISSFTVLKKPVSNVSSVFKESSVRVAKWPLPTQESIVLMKEFSGAELEKLREYSENTRSIDALSRRFNMIYSHIVSPKPSSFDTWLKTTPFDDVDSYFFAIYIACFKGSNYLPADCINNACKETFLSDDIDIMDMVEFSDNEAKKKFTNLYNSDVSAVSGKGIYCTEVVPMNDKIAISFRQPSIYNIFELVTIDDKTRRDYSTIIDYIPYIDTIYIIDMENQQLIPVGYKMFADSNQRTIKSKIQKYNKMLSNLTVDEFAIIKAYVKAIAEKDSGISYVYPAIECPKCHTMTEKTRTTAEELVFTRYQLGRLVNTSLS